MATPSPLFVEFLRTADLATLKAKRAWLDDYMGRSYNGHSEMAANLKLYDEEIARRENAAKDPTITRIVEMPNGDIFYACKGCATLALSKTPGAASYPARIPEEDHACELHYEGHCLDRND